MAVVELKNGALTMAVVDIRLLRKGALWMAAVDLIMG